MSNFTVAIIPARGGSVGVPRKNIRELGGKPLLHWAIEAAQQAQCVDAVCVTTDDAEIADVARAGGADVIERPQELATSTATMEDTLIHALDAIEAKDRAPTRMAIPHCTSPFTLPEDIDGTLKLLDEGYDSAMTAADFQRWLWVQDDHGEWRGVNHDGRSRSMRQERPQEVLECSAVYAMKCDAFRRDRYRFCGRMGVYRVPIWRALEIDEPDDWRMAEAMIGPFKQLSDGR